MKAKNNKAVRTAYFQFSGYLILTVTLAVGSLYFFMKTSSIEVKRILVKTEEYDKRYSRQILLTESVDSIYQYLSLLNTSPKINDLLLQDVISNKKMRLLDELHTMDTKDCMIYKDLIHNLNTLLQVKDSIRIMTIQEELVRGDLLRCVDENKKTSRKLSAGGLIYDKK